MRLIPVAGVSLLLPGIANADVPVLTEADPMAKAMGFRNDTAKADGAKYPKHTNEQTCAKCLHYTTAGAESAKCDLFSKVVPKTGWCSGYSRRP
jgi:hypothetical protein